MKYLSILIFIVVLLLNTRLFNQQPEDRYKQWHRPWLLLLTILVLVSFYSPVVNFLTSFIPWNLVFLEILLCAISGIVWLILKFILLKLGIDELMLRLLQKINTNSYEKKIRGFSSYLVWPYYQIASGLIYTKAGTKFYKWIFLTSTILVNLLFILSFIIEFYYPVKIPTGFALLSTLVFTEYYLYLTTSKEMSEDEIGDPPISGEDAIVDFEKLWRSYLFTFKTGYSSAFITNQISRANNAREENDNMIAQLSEKFAHGGCDIIASDLNLADSFQKFSKILFTALSQGGNILFLAEIPAHFKVTNQEMGDDRDFSNDDKELTEVLAEYFSTKIQEEIPGSSEILKIFYYNADKNADAEKHRLLFTSVNNMLNENLLKSQWIKNLELLVILNFNDACLSTVSENRQFSVLVDSIQTRYKSLIFTPYRNEIHAGLEHTWMLDKIEERRFNDEISASKHFFIGFNFEKWRDNWNAIATPLAGHPVCSGLELSVLPISERVKHIHLLETAYSDFKEGREDLAVHVSAINSIIPNINQSSILQDIFVNVLPITMTGPSSCSREDFQHFSIIYDREYNAPKAHKKYSFLGRRENFSIILSKPHLFREYFAANFDFFRCNSLEAIQPQLSKSKINLSMQLLTLLEHAPINIVEIEALLNKFGIETYISVYDELVELFLQYFNFNIKDNFALNYQSSYEFINGHYCLVETFQLNNSNLGTHTNFDHLKTVNIVDNANNILFGISRDLLFQNFLPKQNISINGRPYLIDNYSSHGHNLHVRKTESLNILFYKSVFNIALSGESRPADQPIDLSFFRQGHQYNLSLSINERSADISTISYYEFLSAYNSPLASEKQPIKYDLSKEEFEIIRREYSNCRILTIEWELLPGFHKNIASITTLLHLFLYESLVAFFPYQHQYIRVCSDNIYNTEDRGSLPWIFPEFKVNHTQEFQTDKPKITIHLLEDSFVDIGILKAFQRNFIYIMKYIYDLCYWFDEEPMPKSGSYQEYEENIEDKGAFIKYGLDLPLLQDWGMIKSFIEVHLPIEQEILYEISRKRSIFGNEDINVECDFCRTSCLRNQVQVMEDGLHRCQSCADGAIDTREQGEALLAECKKIYLDFQNIKFDKLVFDFVMVTAKELHDLNGYTFTPTSKYDPRKLVGLAWDREKDCVYIEKGYKKEQTLSTVIHEICHIWQYHKLDCGRIRAHDQHKYLMEGLPVWAEVTLMRAAGYTDFADHYESVRQNDETEYGIGFRYVKEHYTNPFREIIKEFPKE